MEAFLQPAFLQSLAYGLILSTGQMALLWLLTVVVLKLFKFTAAQKFNIAFAAQLSGFIFFIYTCIDAYQTGAGKIFINTTNAGFIKGVNSIANTLMPYAAILYLGILFFKLVRLTLIFNDTQALKKRQLRKMPVAQRIFVQQMAATFSLHKKVKIYLSEKVICPLTTGFFKPVILIPVAAVNHLTTEQLEAVILHELAHIKRADYLLYILQSMIEKIFFFNVFSGMLGEIIERERENACDDWVLQFRYNAMHYAEALFKLGRLKALPAMAMALQGKKDSLLLMRIKRLLHNPQSNTYSVKPVFSGILCLMLAAVLLLNVSNKIAKVAPGEINYALNVVKEDNANAITAPVDMQRQEKVSAETIKPDKVKKQATKIKPGKPLPVIVAEAEPQASIQVALDAVQNNVAVQNNQLNLKQNYMYKLQQSIDSFKLSAQPQFNQAVATKAELTNDMMQKIISYQNFRQLENMLTATGDSINVIENKVSANSYKKHITIESFDKSGNKHVYEVVVELYQ